MSRTILYYPNINIPNDEWLKKTILYWDHISSIVPDKDYYEHVLLNNEDINYLVENNMYYPSFPSKLFNSSQNRDFNLELEKNLKLNSRFSVAEDRNINRIHRNKLSFRNYNSINREKILFPELAERVHFNKFKGSLYNELIESGLLVDRGGEWLEMDSKVAMIYMSLMAKHLTSISEQPMIVGTDRNKYLYYAYKKTFRSNNSLAYNVCFQNALPEPAPDVPIKKIVKFKKKRKLELVEFQFNLLEFENKLSKCASEDEAKSEIELFKAKLEKSVLELEKVYKDERIGCVFGTIKSLVDTVGAVASILSVINADKSFPTWMNISALNSGGALGFGYSFVQHKKEINQLKQTNGFAYLYDLYHYNMLRNQYLR